jgi:hypothetical protein
VKGGPCREFRPVGRRQSQQLRDHRQRQFSRIALDEIGGAALGKQLVGELVAQRLNMRLHFEHGAAAKRLVDDVAQPPVIGLVHRQHAVGQRANDARHPPLQSRDIAIVLANGEGGGVLQHLIGQRLRRGRPDFANDREPYFHHRTSGAKFCDRGCGIAKIVRAGEVGMDGHELLLHSTAGESAGVIPDKINLHVTTDLILRSLRSKRLEGWQQEDSPPSFETPRNSAAPQDEVGTRDDVQICARVPATRGARGLDRILSLLGKEGAGKTGCALHPRSRVQNARVKTHTSIQVQRKHSGLPCAMALRIIRAHPGDPAFLPPSPREHGWPAPGRAGLASARLDANPEASGPHDFTVRFSIVRRPAVRSLTELIPPCNHLRARRCRVHRIPPRVS